MLINSIALGIFTMFAFINLTPKPFKYITILFVSYTSVMGKRTKSHSVKTSTLTKLYKILENSLSNFLKIIEMWSEFV